jgi:glucosamine--fructose-6-phosphate aminotransferase (isomerizing)
MLPLSPGHHALTKASHIIWSGCGSPYYLAVAAARITQQHDTRPCYAVPASELWAQPSASIPRDAMPTLILLSRSGSTTEVLRAAAQFRQSAPNGQYHHHYLLP